ncbi:MAG: hypothetical protein KAJ34_00595 [Thermodesulfovibrionia bacterium]|nr:hypothetical protein [Thermodesulfovibrionia bacterium]
MRRIIGFASGTIWRWTENWDALINYAQKLDISGFELTIASKEGLYSFSLSETNKSWLRGLDYVSIHAPFHLVSQSENRKEISRQLDIISALYDEIHAKNVVIHPDALPAPHITKKYRFNMATENLPPSSNISVSDLEKTFKKYPGMRLCLDVSHAYLWSQYETGKLVRSFKNKICQIHLSGTYKKKDHQSLRNVTKDFFLSIKPLKKLDVPIVIEEDIHEKDLMFIKEEVEFVQKYFDCFRKDCP